MTFRKAGATYAQIGKELGISEVAAYKAVRRGLRVMLQQANPEELRAIEYARLESMIRAVWARVLNGDLPAIDRAIRISNQISDLMGLKAPERLEVAGPDGGPIEARVEHKMIADPEKLLKIAEVLARAGLGQLADPTRRLGLKPEIIEAEGHEVEGNGNGNGHATGNGNGNGRNGH